MTNSILRVIFPLILFLLIGANASGDGIAGTGSAFHSIVIDGVQYETDDAVVRSNGVPTTIEELQVGHRVYAVVDSATMSATEIDQYDAVVGKIDHVVIIDETLNSYELQILGQVVRTRIETVMHVDDGFKFKEGTKLRINGIRLEDNSILATSVEEPAKDYAPLVMGVVSRVSDQFFEIGGLRVETPYHFEYLQEGWLVPGAAVQVSGGKYRDGVLEADIATLVPADLVTLQDPESLASAESWIEGEIESVDSSTRLVQVNGFDVEVSKGAIMLDKRDRVRTFDFDLLYAGDKVKVVVRRKASGDLVAVKLVRVKKSKTQLRAPVESWDDLAISATLLGSVIQLDDVKDLKFRHQKLKREELEQTVGAGDGLLLEWDSKGTLKKLRVESESERWTQISKGGK